MGGIIGFVMWCIGGCIIIGLGIYALFAKKPMHLWAGDKVTNVSDIRGYNRAMAVFYCILGVVFILLGLPLLIDAVWMLLSAVGVAFEFIIAAAVYATKIERKYRK